MRIGQKLSIPIAIVALGNLVNIAHRSYDLSYYIFYVGIFIPVIIFFNCFKKEVPKKILSFVLLFLSIIGFCFNGDSSLAGVTFLCFSIYISPIKKALIYYSSIVLAVIIIQTTITGLNPSQLAVYLSGSSFIFIIYHHYIHPKGRREIPVQPMMTCDVNRTVVEILQYRANGYDWPEINDILELNVKDDQLPRRVRDERKRMGFKTQDQFILYLVKNGVIRTFSDDSDTRY